MTMRLCFAALLVALFAGVQPAAATTTHAFGFAQPDSVLGPDVTTAAAQYCRTTGGRVEVRTPEYGTNNPNPLVLAGKAVFCQYTAKDGSRIHILASSLYTTQPSLAVLAYYAKPAMSASCGAGGANPASCYCSQLGGSDLFGGKNLAGGAWVLKGSIDEDLEACIFPDMSSIDSWGLTYHSHNIIRGIDLSKVLRYKQKK
jgi:putative hemolysin